MRWSYHHAVKLYNTILYKIIDNLKDFIKTRVNFVDTLDYDGIYQIMFASISPFLNPSDSRCKFSPRPQFCYPNFSELFVRHG